MKKIALLLFILLSRISYSQPFLPMLDEDHQWSVDVLFCPFGGPPDPYVVTAQITIIGEEIINNETYKIISSSLSFSECYVREESGIVYRYNSDIDDDEILFDFNLDIGDFFDTLDTPSCLLGDSTPGTGAQLEVIGTSIQFIAGENRKVIEFQNAWWGEEYWIEGIGSITGFEPYPEILDITCWSKLVCFTKAGTTYFFNNATACDNTTLSIFNHLKDEILLVPNPITDISVLHLPDELQIEMVKIFDVTGKLIREFLPKENYILINAMQYRSGIYFFQVLTENTVLKADRFIVE